MRREMTFAMLLVAFTPAMAADIHVASSGNDTASGAVSDPLRTLATAVERAASGDTILVHDGVYEGGVTLRRDNITLRSAPGEYAAITSPSGEPDVTATITIAASADNVTLDRLDIRGGHDYTIHLLSEWNGFTVTAANGIQLSNLNLRDAGITLLRAEAGTDFTLSHSTLSYPGQRDPERGVLVASRALDSTLRNNALFGGYYTGIEITGGASSATLEGNYFTGPVLAAVSLDPALAAPTDFAINGASEPVAASNVVIRNNVFQYLEGAAISLRGSDSAIIMNNSFVGFRSAQPVGRIQEGTVGSDSVVNDAVTLANNVLVFDSPSSLKAWVIEAGAVTSHDFNDNVYFRRGGTVRFEFGGNSLDLAGWQAATGQADRSRETDPVLMSDGHLDATSSLIDSGRNAGAPTVDYDGNLRNDAAVDIGADEYSVSGVVDLPPDTAWAGTGVADGSGEGLFEIRGVSYRTGGGALAGGFLVLLAGLAFRRLRRANC